MLVEKIMEAKQAKARVYPVHTNRASKLGHPCLRYLVYERTRWMDKKVPSADLILRFEIGEEYEKQAIRDLQEAGFVVIEQQKDFFWKEYNITGHIDGKILVGTKAYPIEIKSMSPAVFSKINTLDDMKKAKWAYLRQYPAQMILYLLLDEKEQGVMLLKDKSSGAYKEIWVQLDYDFGEELIKKAEQINNHVANNTLPDRINDDSICANCEYEHICVPEIRREELNIIDDTEMAELLQKYWELKPIAKEFEEIDKLISEKVKELDKAVVGDFLITGTWRETTRYKVPKDIQAQYAVKERYWVKKISKIA